MTSPSVDLTSGILSVSHETQSTTLAPAGSRPSMRSTPETTSRRRRQREQREVPEHPPVSRRPLPGARDGVQRATPRE